jgi:hypothetical protein
MTISDGFVNIILYNGCVGFHFVFWLNRQLAGWQEPALTIIQPIQIEIHF